MDPATLAMISQVAQAGGAVLPIVGALIGRFLGQGDRDAARELMERAVKQWNIPLPDLQKVVAEQAGPSALENFRTDPQADAAQRAALTELQRVAGGQGADIETRAAQAAAESEANRSEGAMRAAALRDMSARGMAGSGAELAARMSGEATGANRAAATGFAGALEGRRQALQALSGAASVAGTIRGQSAQEQQSRAAAVDAANRFNAGMRWDASRFNANIPQQQFQNQTELARGRSGAMTNLAGYHQNEAQSWQNLGAGVGAGAGQASAAYGEKFNEDEAQLKKLRGGG